LSVFGGVVKFRKLSLLSFVCSVLDSVVVVGKTEFRAGRVLSSFFFLEESIRFSAGKRGFLCEFRLDVFLPPYFSQLCNRKENLNQKGHCRVLLFSRLWVLLSFSYVLPTSIPSMVLLP